jgi:homoserine O-acetyltransferase/O-succinyltransferase
MLTAAVATARGQTPQASPQAKNVQQFAALGDFKLASGDVIRDCRIGYRTLGTLNAEKSNAILWPTWLGGISHDLLTYVGPGGAVKGAEYRAVDSNAYYVILVDAIGNGLSTSPSNSKAQPLMQFPRITIRDMVEAEHRLVTEALGITHLHAVMGVSMGGMQTFEWAVRYPDFMDLAIPIVGSPQSTFEDKLLWTSSIRAIELDPAWHDGAPTGPLDPGLVLANLIEEMNSTSPDYKIAHTQPREFDAFLADMSKDAKQDGGAAADLIRQRQAIIDLDIPSELGVTLPLAAKQVHARMLVFVSPQDHMVNPHPAQEFAAAIGAPVITMDTPCGHLSFGFQCVPIGPVVARFLADPGSVHSQTLHDSGAH